MMLNGKTGMGLNPGHVSGRYTPPYRSPERVRCMTASTVRVTDSVNSSNCLGIQSPLLVIQSSRSAKCNSLFAMFHIL